MSQVLHWMLFRQGSLGYRCMASFSRFADKRPRLARFLGFFERGAKRALYDCRECGDCALPETFYLCPESQCPKYMRNGPCGGSRVDGHCEVFPNRYCIWERIYWRARRRGKVETINYVITPRDWRLYETPSWPNFYLKRDHTSGKIMLPPLPRD